MPEKTRREEEKVFIRKNALRVFAPNRRIMSTDID
jgi:hypothetical protein